MRFPCNRNLLVLGTALLTLLTAGPSARTAHADEICLKDGKKLYGVIVAYENHMFKVKTDFGYVLVEKDKIAQINPGPSSEAEAAKAAAKTSSEKPANAMPTISPAGDSGANDFAVSESPAAPPAPTKREKTAAILSNANGRPELPTSTSRETTAPVLKQTGVIAKPVLTAAPAPPPPPKEEPAASKEEIQGNLYINHEFGFRMYKAPSWQVIEGAKQALPNSIVAMGTSNESTLLVIGREKTKRSLEIEAQGVEQRLHDIYQNYRLISQRNTAVGGLPAVEYHYRGLADDHDWSGTLAVVSRNGEIFTVLGMTFADTDLIQIQENVITRSIASLNFNSK
jgi:hypothetical protein